MSWTIDPRLTKRYGNIVLESERDGEHTAHRITLSPERVIRVLPDEAHSGQKRALVVRAALEGAKALGAIDGALVETYVAGVLGREGLVWEVVDLEREQLEQIDPEEWLTEWFTNRREPDPRRRRQESPAGSRGCRHGDLPHIRRVKRELVNDATDTVDPS